MEQGQTQTQPLDALAKRGLGGTSALAWGSPSPQSAGGPAPEQDRLTLPETPPGQEGLGRPEHLGHTRLH